MVLFCRWALTNSLPDLELPEGRRNGGDGDIVWAPESQRVVLIDFMEVALPPQAGCRLASRLRAARQPRRSSRVLHAWN